jgi:hypothetical protein
MCGEFERILPPARRWVASANHGELRQAKHIGIAPNVQAERRIRQLAQQRGVLI